MDSDVQKIKDKLSIAEVVGQYLQLKKAGRNYTARCPFHKERTPSFMVSPERGTYMCFGCGEKGDIFSFVQKMENVDFPTALRQLAERAGVKLQRQFIAAPEHKEKNERLRAACEAAAAFFELRLQEHAAVLRYVRSRGVEEDTVRQWRIGYAPARWRSLSEHLATLGFSHEELVDAGLAIRSEKKPDEIYDRFRGRIMFPLFDPGGAVVAFSGRFFEKVPGSQDEGEPAKYVNSPETVLFKKSRMLYGLNFAKTAIRKADCLLLVEGQFDVILAHQSGLPITLAISGTALTEEHLSLMGRYSKRLVLALDNDAAGIRAGLKSARTALAAGFDIKVPTFPEGKDPADLAKENPELLKAAVRTSRSAIEFFLEALRPHAKDERGYKKLVETELLPLVRAIPSQIEQEHFMRLIAERLGVSEAAVRTEARKLPAHAAPSESPIPLVPPQEELPPLERAAGMLLFSFPEDIAMQERLADILGAGRVRDLTERLAGESERLRFMFESLGADAAAAAGELLRMLERMTLEEEMRAVREELRAGGEQQALARKLSALKTREQQLRE